MTEMRFERLNERISEGRQASEDQAHAAEKLYKVDVEMKTYRRSKGVAG